MIDKPLAVFTGLALFLWGLWLAFPGSASINDLRLHELVATDQELRLGIFVMVCAIPSLFVGYVYNRRPMIYILSKSITLSVALFGLVQLLSIDPADPFIAFFLTIIAADSYALYLEFREDDLEE